MTLRGTEYIPRNELLLRLELGGLPNPETILDRAAAESQLSKLMLSFFFNPLQPDLGCEFTHKSFREYLFAEAIIAALKRNATLPGASPQRTTYWREFEQGDPRQALVEEVILMLSAQWIRPEVWRHLAWLLEWEVRRTVATGGIPGAVEETGAA